MSDSTAIGIAKVAAAMAELMHRRTSPEDEAIQAGIRATMREVIRQQTSQDPNLLKCPTAIGPGPGRRQEPKREFGDLSRALLSPAGRGWQEPREIGPPIEPGSVAEKIQNALIDQACGPLKPKAEPKAGPDDEG